MQSLLGKRLVEIMEIKEGAISKCKLLVNRIKTDYKAVQRLLHYISF